MYIVNSEKICLVLSIVNRQGYRKSLSRPKQTESQDRGNDRLRMSNGKTIEKEPALGGVSMTLRWIHQEKKNQSAQWGRRDEGTRKMVKNESHKSPSLGGLRDQDATDSLGWNVTKDKTEKKRKK